MNLSAQIQRIVDFLTAGKPVNTLTYQPEDVASEMSTLETGLVAGLSGKHLNNSVFRILPFTGVDGTGEEPDLTCTFTGALEGDTVAAVIKTSDFSDARSSFESEISAAGYIEQISLTDLSTSTYLALLIKD